MKPFVKALVIFIVIAIAVAFVIPIILKWKINNNSGELHSQQYYDSLYHQLDSVKKEFSLLELKLKASDAHTDSLENIIKSSKDKTNILIERKNEKLRIINNSTPTQLDSIMSTININSNGN